MPHCVIAAHIIFHKVMQRPINNIAQQINAKRLIKNKKLQCYIRYIFLCV